jgi:hypothetical protein
MSYLISVMFGGPPLAMLRPLAWLQHVNVGGDQAIRVTEGEALGRSAAACARVRSPGQILAVRFGRRRQAPGGVT